MQKVRCHPPLRAMAPTVCRHTVSGSLSLPSQGCFSPFPHGTCSLSVAEEYLALRGGPRRFQQGSTCPVVLGCLPGILRAFTTTGLLPAMARLSSPVPLHARINLDGLHHPTGNPTTRMQQRCNAYTCMRLGSSPFARRYSGNRSFFLFLRLLRCFSSPRSPHQAYGFSL